jgi:hypothetical protein
LDVLSLRSSLLIPYIQAILHSKSGDNRKVAARFNAQFTNK